MFGFSIREHQTQSYKDSSFLSICFIYYLLGMVMSLICIICHELIAALTRQITFIQKVRDVCPLAAQCTARVKQPDYDNSAMKMAEKSDVTLASEPRKDDSALRCRNIAVVARGRAGDAR